MRDIERETARAFVEMLLREAVTFADLLGDLHDAMLEAGEQRAGAVVREGESPAEALLDMVAGTVQPVVAAAGPDAVASASALISATLDRMLADLRAVCSAQR